MRRRRGFTLIEIAVVVALIGIMLTAGLKIAGALLDNAASTTTIKRQQAIKDALINYLGTYKRLPCPDTGAASNAGAPDGSAPDGIENRNPAGTTSSNPCAGAAGAAPYGIVPYATLGLPRDAALDGWQNYFGYQIAQVGGANPDAWAMAIGGTPNQYPEANPAGTITVTDRNPNNPTTVTTVTSNAVVVLISYGRNGGGAITLNGTPVAYSVTSLPGDEYANATARALASPSYMARQLTDNTGATGGSFDDIVLYLTASDLVGPLYQSNALAPPAAGANQQVNTIRNAVLAYELAQASIGCPAWSPSGGPPPPAPPSPAITVTVPTWANLSLPASFPSTDPWGSPWSAAVSYNRNLTSVSSTTTNAGGAAVIITSSTPPGQTTPAVQNFIYPSDIQANLGPWFSACLSQQNQQYQQYMQQYCQDHPSSQVCQQGGFGG